LRGDGDEEDETDYDELFKFSKWENIQFNEYDPETASKHRLNIAHEKPTEIWELVYRLAKKKGGMVEPTMVDNSWKITFYPKDEKKVEEKEAKAVQGDTGGGAPVEVDEEEEKKD